MQVQGSKCKCGGICGRYSPYSIWNQHTKPIAEPWKKHIEYAWNGPRHHFASQKYELIHLRPCRERFNRERRVHLGAQQISPKRGLKVLGLWIEGKLRWRMVAQKMALTKVAASTRGYAQQSTTGIHGCGTSSNGVWCSCMAFSKGNKN